MSDGFSHWDPRGAGAGGDQRRPSPDVDPILRRVRLNFLLAGFVTAGVLTAGLNPVAPPTPVAELSLPVVGAVAFLVLALLVVAAWNLRPARLLLVGKRELDDPDPRARRPRIERARAGGLQGLVLGWTIEAITVAAVPVLTGVALRLLHDETWPLLAFGALGIGAGVLFAWLVGRAVRRAVDDPALTRVYGTR